VRSALIALGLPLLAFGGKPDPLDPVRLAAIHAHRVEWMKQRAPLAPPLGIYLDYRMVAAPYAAYSEAVARAAKNAEANVVWLSPGAGSRVTGGILFLDGAIQKPELPHFDEDAEGLPAAGGLPAKDRNHQEVRRAEIAFKQFPDEVYAIAGRAWLAGLKERETEARFRHASTHILARELTEADIRESLAGGHYYLAHDWLCDPTGFTFVATNYFGAFDMGDNVPMLGPITGEANLEVHLPIPAKIKLFRDDKVVAEANDSKLHYGTSDAGVYRLEASLLIDGYDIPWIRSNPIYVRSGANLELPNLNMSPNVEVHKDITYVDGAPEDAAKHKLDVYLPKGKTNFPVLVFFHGGSWKSGDRALYPTLGDLFAKAGIGVVIPSYRLWPKNLPPAQIEDAAAAFAWVYKNMEAYGGDMRRIYLVGHSSGAHLATLLALDPRYLQKLGVPMSAIHGVAALSGVYDVSQFSPFAPGEGKWDASPLHYVHPGAPPFLVTYCQWDYYTLPKQARDFEAALKKSFIETRYVYIPGQSHISEMVNIWKDGDRLAQAVLDFVR
jgi:acetyl esterase/lipase